MKYVLLHTRQDGSTIAVNLAAVCFIQSISGGGSLLMFAGELRLEVTESPSEIRALAIS